MPQFNNQANYYPIEIVENGVTRTSPGVKVVGYEIVTSTLLSQGASAGFWAEKYEEQDPFYIFAQGIDRSTNKFVSGYLIESLGGLNFVKAGDGVNSSGNYRTNIINAIQYVRSKIDTNVAARDRSGNYGGKEVIIFPTNTRNICYINNKMSGGGSLLLFRGVEIIWEQGTNKENPLSEKQLITKYRNVGNVC